MVSRSIVRRSSAPSPFLLARPLYSGVTVHSPTLSGAAEVELLDSWVVESTTTNDPGSRAVSSGTDRVLFYMAFARSGIDETVTSVSYGGQAMTEVGSVLASGSGPDMDGSLWILDESGITVRGGDSLHDRRGDNGPLSIGLIRGHMRMSIRRIPSWIASSIPALTGQTPRLKRSPRTMAASASQARERRPHPVRQPRPGAT